MGTQYTNHNRKEIWKQLQVNENRAYMNSDNGRGIFSVDGFEIAEKVGDEVESNMNGLCLDVGCGMLAKPSYMRGNGNVRYIGIDPFFGDKKRSFLFAQAIGEHLPFKSNSFDGVFFATTIDHVIEPKSCVKETFKVLKPKGKLFVWFSNRDENWKPYPHDIHQWGFNLESLTGLIKECGFVLNSVLNKFRDNLSHLVIAEKSC